LIGLLDLYKDEVHNHQKLRVKNEAKPKDRLFIIKKVPAVLRIRDPVLFYPLVPGSGSGYVFGENPCPSIFLLIKLAPETIKSKEKVGFIFHPYFYVQ
jgi:hypothetical protein